MENIVYVTLIIVFFEILISIIYIYYLYQYYKYKDLYPLKQLSVKLTIAQGISFFIYQLNLIILLLLEANDKMFTWQDCENKKPINFIQNYFIIQQLIYLTSRGCGFTYTVIKSCRTLCIFSNNQILGWKKKFCENENYLLILGIIYGLVFPICSFVQTKIYQFPYICALQIYENNTGLVMYNSLLEEFLTVIQIFLINKYFQSDKIVQLTLKLQFAYIFWFSINSIVFKIGNHYDMNFMIGIMISCWLRCHFMFYFLIVYPFKKREEHPNIYLPLNLIQSFEEVLKKKNNVFYKNIIVLKIFKEYLRQLKTINTEDFRFQIDFTNQTEIQIFEIFLELDEKMYLCNYINLTDYIYSKFKIQENSYNNIDQINEDLFFHFNQLYQKFQLTKSYASIRQIYKRNYLILLNFQILKVQIKQFFLIENIFRSQSSSSQIESNFDDSNNFQMNY